MAACLLTLALAGCGRELHVVDAKPAAGDPAHAGLPDITALDDLAPLSGLRQTSSGGQTINMPMAPIPVAQSAGATPQDDGYVLAAAEGEMEWIVVRCDDFAMQPHWWMIKMQLIAGEAWYGYADFSEDRWVFFKHNAAAEDFSGWPRFDYENPDYLSPQGNRYYAIVVANGSAVNTGGSGVYVTTGQPLNVTLRELQTYSATKLVEFQGYPAIVFNDAADGKLKVVYTHNDFPFFADDWEEAEISSLPDEQCYLDAVALGDKLYVTYIADNSGELHIAWTQGALSQSSQWTDVLSHTGDVGQGETLQHPRLAGFQNKLYLAFTNWDPQDLNSDGFSYQICFANLDGSLAAQPYKLLEGNSLGSPRAALAVVAGRPAMANGDKFAEGLSYRYTLSSQPQSAADWTAAQISAEQYIPDGVYLFDRRGKPVIFAEAAAKNVLAAYAPTASPAAADWVSHVQPWTIGEPGTFRATMNGDYSFWMSVQDQAQGIQYYEHRGMSYYFDPTYTYAYSRQLQDTIVGSYDGADCAEVAGQPAVSWVKHEDGQPVVLQYTMQTY